MWNGLGVNKAEKEKEFVCLSCPSSEASLYESSRYIEDLKKVTLIKQISSTESIWNTYYHIPPPLSHRIFTVLQVTRLEETSPRTGYVFFLNTDVIKPSSLQQIHRLSTH